MPGDQAARDWGDELYGAIGRYVVAFSYLAQALRDGLATQLTSSQLRPLPWIVMGEMTAQPLANSFFGACRLVANYTDDERGIAKALAKSVSDEIKYRNDIAHGDWAVNAWRFARTPTGVAELYRLRPARKEGHVELKMVNPPELELRADDVEHLANLVTEFGICAFNVPKHGHERVSDILELQDGVVVRRRR